MSRRLFKSGLTSAKTVLGLGALLMSVTASALEKTPAGSAETDPTVDDTVGGEMALQSETAVFARFKDLGSDETIERLDSLLSNDESAELIYSLTNALSYEGVTAQKIESTMLGLIKGMDIDDSDVTIAAVMLDHYDNNIAERLEAGKISHHEAFDELIDTADVVITAAYGSSALKAMGKPTKKQLSAKRLRHRL